MAKNETSNPQKGIPITLDDIPERYREFAETMGLDHFLALCKTCGGEQMYVPRYENVCAEMRNKVIRQEYCGGASIAQLAAKYALTQRRILQIVSEYPPPNHKT